MAPNGFDLFGRGGWPPDEWMGDVTQHPSYQEFLSKARKAGFLTSSYGFRESERAYFMFYLMGAGKEGMG